MDPAGGNLFADLPSRLAQEQVDELLAAGSVRIERIVSTGQCSPPGHWYDQEEGEWVMLLQGSAAVRFAAEPQPRRLRAGDCLHIPPHARHRVEWTDPAAPTLWLAVYYR